MPGLPGARTVHEVPCVYTFCIYLQIKILYGQRMYKRTFIYILIVRAVLFYDLFLPPLHSVE